MKKTKAPSRLGTQLRGKLAAAYGVRGHQLADLYYVYSPRTDKDWVIRSDLCFDHFVLTEADSTVIDIDYSPKIEISVMGTVKFDAIVRYADGATQWHHVLNGPVKPVSEASPQLRALREVAEHEGAQLRCFDESSLHQHETRLWNWRRAIAWMSAARGTALAPYMTELAAFIHPRGSVALADIAELGARELFPLYAAAAFRLVQRGDLVGDLDEFPISMLTTFSAPG